MSITASPLTWPDGWKRTPAHQRGVGPFSSGNASSRKPISIEAATQRLRAELRRFGVHDRDIILSTNLRLRLDGFPYAAQSMPADPGAAVYWKDVYTDQPRSMAIDRYTKVEQNIAALAATIDAMRAIERHGGAAVVERAFTGFAALPAPPSWRKVLEVPDEEMDREAIVHAYRKARSKAHAQGAVELGRVQFAYEQFQKELP